MSRDKFTPGPWEAKKRTWTSASGIYRITDYMVVAPADADWTKQKILYIRSCHQGPPEEPEADMNLIAAAPEMLSALGDACEMLRSTGRCEEISCADCRLRIVMDKAHGKEARKGKKK